MRPEPWSRPAPSLLPGFRSVRQWQRDALPLSAAPDSLRLHAPARRTWGWVGRHVHPARSTQCRAFATQPWRHRRRARKNRPSGKRAGNPRPSPSASDIAPSSASAFQGRAAQHSWRGVSPLQPDNRLPRQGNSGAAMFCGIPIRGVSSMRTCARAMLAARASLST